MNSGAITDRGAARAGAAASDAGAPGPASRLLVVAPHPDDETIAAAGLMQQARAAGAQVRVWLLTDGDNNPWPQRWLERRWRLDAGARARWGARRRAESAAALRQLGLDPGAVLLPFGWPDGGLTDRFLADPAGITATLARELRAFAPTHLVTPVAADGHPDHGAAALLLALAARQAGIAPRTLAYRIHGGRCPPGAQGRDLGEAEWGRKQRAVAEYATQAALTGPRLRRLAGRREAFLPEAFGTAGAPGLAVRLEGGPGGTRLACDLPWPHPPLAGLRLLAVAATEGSPAVAVVAGPGLAGAGRRRGAGTRISVPAVDAGTCETFVKLEPLRRGLWIYDRYPWVRLLAQPRLPSGTGRPQPPRRVP